MSSTIKNNSFIKKLRLVSWATATVLVISIACEFYSNKVVTQSYKETTSRTIPELVSVLKLAQQSSYLTAITPTLLENNNKKDLEKNIASLDELTKAMQQDLSFIIKNKTSEELKIIKNNIDKLLANIQTLSVKIEEKQKLEAKTAEIKTKLKSINRQIAFLATPLVKGNLELYNKSISELSTGYKNKANLLSNKLQHGQGTYIEAIDGINNFVGTLNTFDPQRGYGACQASFSVMNNKLAALKKLNITPSLTDNINNLKSTNICDSVYGVEYAELSSIPAYIRDLTAVVSEISNIQKANVEHASLGVDTVFNELERKIPQTLNQRVNDIKNAQQLALEANLLAQYLNNSLGRTDVNSLSSLKKKSYSTISVINKLSSDFKLSSLAAKKPGLIERVNGVKNNLTNLLNKDATFNVAADLLKVNKEINSLQDANAKIANDLNTELESAVSSYISESKARENLMLSSSNAVALALIAACVLGILSLVLLVSLVARKLEENDSLLNKAIKSYKKYKREKHGVLTTIRRDMRAPVNTIVGLSDALLNTNSRETQAKLYSYLRQSAHELLSATTNILSLEEYTENKIIIRPTTFNPQDLVSVVSNVYLKEIQEKDLELEHKINYQLSKQLIGDQAKIQQVLLLLMDNAVKFTSSGKITLGLSVTAKDEKTASLIFKVKDTGKGIKKTQKINIFKSFVRLGNNSKGAGLGLTICERLVNAMNGKLSLGTKEQQGSLFTVSIDLPISKADINKDFKQVQAQDFTYLSNTGLSILVIEADELRKTILQSGLERNKHKVVLASTKEEIMASLNAGGYDIILLANEDRKSVNLKQLRAIAPTIVLADDITDKLKAGLLKVRIEHCLERPINWSELNKLIYKIAGVKSSKVLNIKDYA